MEVIQDQALNKRAAFFTGDGEASRIFNYVTGPPAPGHNNRQRQPRHYSIYKIPHHGSQEHQDNEWDTVNIGVPQKVLNEAVLFYLAFRGPGFRLPLWEETNSMTQDIVAGLAEYVQSSLLVQGHNGLSNRAQMLKHWKRVLQTRHQQYVQQLLVGGSLNVVYNSNDNPEISQFIAKYKRDMSATWNNTTGHFEPTPMMRLHGIQGDALECLENGQRQEQEWYHRYFYAPTRLLYTWANRYAKIARFFRSFTADAYVASGSASVHGHPTVAIMAGLALACLTTQRAATLYLTDPGMAFLRGQWTGAQGANWPDLPTASQICGFTTEDLLSGPYLNIRFLARDYMMSLNADVTLQGDQAVDRDENGMTRLLVNFENSGTAREIYDHLKKTASVLPIGDAGRLEAKTWRIVATIAPSNRNPTDYFIGLAVHPAGGYFINCTHHPAELLVDDRPGVNDLGRNGIDAGSGFHIHIAPPADARVHFRLYLQKAEIEGHTYWEIQYLDSGNNQTYGFFWNIQNRAVNVFTSPVLQVQLHQQPQTHVVRFHVLQTPGNTDTMQAAGPLIDPVPRQTVIMTRVDDGAAAGTGVADNFLLEQQLNNAGDSAQEAETELPLLQQALVPTEPSLSAVTVKMPTPTPAPAPAPASTEALPIHAVDTTTSCTEMRRYLELRGMDPKTVPTRAAALRVLLGRSNAQPERVTRLKMYQNLFASSIDLDKSTVDFTQTDAHGFDFKAAHLVEENATSTRVHISEHEYEVSALDLVREDDDVLRFSTQLHSATEPGFTMTATTKLEDRVPSVRDFLLKTGADPKTLQEVTLIRLLSFCFRSETRALDLLCGGYLPSAISLKALAFLKPDLDSSEAVYEESPTGGVRLTHAKIPCAIAGVTGLPELDLSMVKIRLSTLGFELTNPVTSSAASVSFFAEAKAVATASSEKGNGLGLALRVDMSDHQAEMSFTATNLKSLVDIAEALSINYSELAKMQVPFSKSKTGQGHDGNFPFSSLGSLQSNPRTKSTSVGFTILENRKRKDKGFSSYSFSSVFVTVNFDEWMDYLPSEIQLPRIEGAVATITVLDPTVSKRRRIKADIHFNYYFDRKEKKKKKKKTKNSVAEASKEGQEEGEEAEEVQVDVKRYIHFRLKADPIADATDYDFQLDVQCDTGLSIEDVALAIGLHLDTDLMTSFPPLESFIKEIRMKRLYLGLQLVSGKFMFRDWSVQLLINQMTLLPKFVLSGMELTVSKTLTGAFVCEGKAKFFIETVKKYFLASCRIPQATLPGFVEVSAPNGLKLSELLHCFSNLDVSAVPVVKDLLDISLNKFRVEFGYKRVNNSLTTKPIRDKDKDKDIAGLSIFGISASVSKSELLIPISGGGKTIKFTNMELSLSWFSKDCFFEPDSKSVVTFSASTTLPLATYGAKIRYHSAKSSLLVELIPKADSTVGDLLKHVLAEDMAGVIVPVIGDLALVDGSILINTGDKCVDELNIAFEKTHSVEVNKSSGSPISIGSLTLHYHRGRVSQPPKGAATAQAKLEETGDGAKTASSSQGDPAKTSLHLLGVIELSGLPAKAEFHYLSAAAVKQAPSNPSKAPEKGSEKMNEPEKKQSADKADEAVGTMSFRVSPVDSGALDLRSFAKLFGLGDLEIDSPDPDKQGNFLDLGISAAEGIVDILPSLSSSSTQQHQQQQQQKATAPPDSANTKHVPPEPAPGPKTGRFRLSTFEVTVQNPKPFTLLDSTPPVELEKLSLKLEYSSAKAPITSSHEEKHNITTKDNKSVSNTQKPHETEANSRTTVAGFKALVYGSFTVAERHVELVYQKSGKHGSAFIGRLGPIEAADKTKPELDIGHFADRFLGKAATGTAQAPQFKFPDTPNLSGKKIVASASFIFVPGSHLEIALVGESPWHGQFGDDFKFSIDRLGAYIKVSKADSLGSPPHGRVQTSKPSQIGDGNAAPGKAVAKGQEGGGGKYKYEIHLVGKMTISHFTAVQAQLDISPDKHTTLFASITKSTGTGTLADPTHSTQDGDASILAGGIVKKDDANNWTTLIASTGPKPLVFESGVILSIDFTAERMVATGSLKDIGKCIIMGKKLPEAEKITDKKKSKYGFYVSLAAQNVEQLWAGQKSDISDVFRIKKLAGQFVSYDTSVQGLMDDLTTGKIEPKGDLPTDVVTEAEQKDAQGQKPQGIPALVDSGQSDIKTLVSKINQGSKPITPGAWFFAEIEFPSSSDANYSLSSSLALATVDKENPKEMSHGVVIARTPPSLLLFACIMKDRAKSVYGIRLDNLTLLGGKLHLSGGGTYYPGDKAAPGSRKVILKDAIVEVDFSEKQTLKLTVDFYIDETTTWFVTSTAGTLLGDPFEKMFNVKLIELSSTGTFTKTSQSVTIRGKVAFGGHREDMVTAEILLQRWKPRGVYLKYDNDNDNNKPGSWLKVGDLCSKILSGSSTDPADKQVSWPADSHPNFAFQSVIIYYVTAGDPLPHGTKKLAPGFHLEASVYLFDQPFDLKLDVGAARHKGVAFTAVYKKPLDLEIVQLTYYEDPVTKAKEEGPAISVGMISTDSGNKTRGRATIDVKAGLSIFDCSPIPVKISYEPRSKSFFVPVPLPLHFLGETEAHSVGFRYKNGRWSFEGLKINDEFLTRISDVKSLMQKGSKRTRPGCGELVNIAWAKVIQGKWKFGLALPEDKTSSITTIGKEKDAKPSMVGGRHQSLLNARNLIELHVTCQYDVHTPLKTEPLFSIHFTMPNLEIEPRIKKEGIMKKLGDLVADYAERLADQLASDGENLTKLLEVVAIERLGPEIAAALFCRGAKDPKLRNRVNRHVEKQGDESESKLQELLKTALQAAVAVAITTAITAGATTAGEGILKGLLIIAAMVLVIAVLEKLKDAIDKHGSEEEKKKVKKILDEAKERLRKAEEEIKKVREALELAMSIMTEVPTFRIKTDESKRVVLEVDWAGVVPKILQDDPAKPKQDITWLVEVANNNEWKNSAVKSVKDATACLFEDTTGTWACSSQFFVRVKAAVYVQATVRNQVTNLDETREDMIEAARWNPTRTLKHVPFLPAPSHVTLIPGAFLARVTVDHAWTHTEVVVGQVGSMNLSSEQYARLSTPVPSTLETQPFGLVAPEGYPSIKDGARVQAYARNVPSDPSQGRPSDWTSSSYVPISDHVSNMVVVSDGPRVMACWTSTAPSTTRPLMYIITSAGNRWIEAASVSQDLQPPDWANRSYVAYLPPESVKHEAYFRLAVCDNAAVPSGTVLPVFVKSKHEFRADYLPWYPIDEGYYLDLDQGVLHLSLWTPFFCPIPHRIFLRVSSSDGKVEELDFSDTGPFLSGQQHISVQVANIRPPIDATVRVIVEDNETKSQRLGQPRTLTVPYSDLPVPALTVWTVAPGSLQVSWTAVEGVSIVGVSVTPLQGLLRDSSRDVRGTSTSVIMTADPGDKWNTSPGSSYKIKAVAKNPGVVGKASEIYYTVPKRVVMEDDSDDDEW